MKARIIEELKRLGHSVADLGTNSTDHVDYPDYAVFSCAYRTGAAQG